MSDKAEWWQDFFTGPVLDFVCNSRDEATNQEEADFIEQTLGLSPGAKILDVPCGGGRLSLEMVRRGYQVTGVDVRPELLDSARGNAASEKLPLELVQGDMRDLHWHGEFDAVLCWWSSFGYFDESGNAAFLAAVTRALKPGGRFLLDTPLIETRLPEMEAQERIWWPVGDLLALEERSFNHETSRVESEWTFIRSGETEHKRLSVRLYTYRELTLLLESAGFSNHQAYGSLEWEPFSLGATWLYLMTTKVDGPS